MKFLFLYKCLLAVCLMTLIACLAVDALAEVMEVRLVQARGGMKVRSGPGAEFGTVYLLDDCETVVVLGHSNGWAKISKNYSPSIQLGWVNEIYLK